MRSSLVAHVVFVLIASLAWSLSDHFNLLDEGFIPRIDAVASALSTLLGDPTFLQQARITCMRVLAAIVIATPIAFTVGFAMGEFYRFGRLLSPSIYLGLAVPQSIFLPLFMMVFGIDDLQKIVFGFTHAFFVMTVITVAAVQSVQPTYAVAARSFGANTRQVYTGIFLPSMAPLLIGAIRLGLIFDIIGVLGAEMYGSRRGLGILLFRWGEEFQLPKLAGAVLLIAVSTIVMNEVLRAAELRLEHWKVS